jgi:predicted Zn-dependent peptidase
MANWYHGPNMVLSVAGNVRHADVVASCERLFAGVSAVKTLPATSPYDPAQMGPPLVVDRREIDQCTLFMGMPIFGRDDPDRHALRLMNDVLGAGMSSRLFREVRERRGLAYSVGSGYGYLADAGSFTISAGVEGPKLEETIRVCRAELARMATELVAEDELHKATEHTIGRFRLSLETAFSLGQRHGELMLTRGEVESVEEFVAAIGAVTPADVQRVAARILGNGRMHASVVGPAPDDDLIANALAA